MTFGRAKPLKAKYLAILDELAREGPRKAFFFEEDELDELFKMRPKLIRLVSGHDEAVIEITPEGSKRLAMELKK